MKECRIDLGSGPPDLTTPSLPRYPKLVPRVFERLGASARDFTGFRLRIAYPPIPTLALFRHSLPERARTVSGAERSG